MKFLWGWLICGIAITTVAAMGVHAFMSGPLHVPYPYSYPHKGWAVFPDVLVSTFAAVVVAPLLDNRFQKLSVNSRCILFFLLLSTIKESLFRAAFMDIMNSHSIVYPVVQALPRLLSIAVTACLIVLSQSRSSGHLAKIITAVVISVFVFFVFGPVTDAVFAHVLNSISWMSSLSLYEPPYDYHILVPAYLSFLEPVFAAFFLAGLSWSGLPARSARRVLVFTVLILALKGPMLKPLFAIRLVHAPVVMAFLSEGQFSVEAVTLGLLTALTWTVVGRSAIPRIGGNPVNLASK